MSVMRFDEQWDNLTKKKRGKCANPASNSLDLGSFKINSGVMKRNFIWYFSQQDTIMDVIRTRHENKNTLVFLSVKFVKRRC